MPLSAEHRAELQYLAARFRQTGDEVVVGDNYDHDLTRDELDDLLTSDAALAEALVFLERLDRINKKGLVASALGADGVEQEAMDEMSDLCNEVQGWLVKHRERTR